MGVQRAAGGGSHLQSQRGESGACRSQSAMVVQYMTRRWLPTGAMLRTSAVPLPSTAARGGGGSGTASGGERRRWSPIGSRYGGSPSSVWE